MADTAALQRELERAGTEQNRKVFRRHGVTSELFGVSYAALREIAKRAGINQEAAQQLWASGNHDARILATMIADARAITKKELEHWAKALDNYVITDAFCQLAARTPHARALFEDWASSSDEWRGSAAWTLLAVLAAREDEFTDDELREHLQTIEGHIHAAKNRVKYAMNSALIAIGIRGGTIERAAVDAAARIGPVEVDHGETGCRTHDAAEYIAKARARSSASAPKKPAPRARTKRA